MVITANLDQNSNPKMRKIHAQVKKRFYWGEMDVRRDISSLDKILWWKVRNGGYYRWFIVKEPSLVSIIEGEEVGYRLFPARSFQAGQTVTVYIGVHYRETR